MTQHDTLPPTDWTGIDGATAFHIIDRHAEGWEQAGQMMDAWADARAKRSDEASAQAFNEQQVQEHRQREEVHLLDAVTALPWRPIDSAPKDGTNLVLAHPASPTGWVEGWFHSGYWCERGGVMQPQPEHYLPITLLQEANAARCNQSIEGGSPNV